LHPFTTMSLVLASSDDPPDWDVLVMGASIRDP
jgi:hypothetical protein